MFIMKLQTAFCITSKAHQVMVFLFVALQTPHSLLPFRMLTSFLYSLVIELSSEVKPLLVSEPKVPGRVDSLKVAVKPLSRTGLPSSILLCGYDMDPGSQNLAIIYRVSYKVLNTVCPKANNLDSKAPEKPLENQEPIRISQFADGEVEIQLSSARRTRIDLAPSRSNLEPHRLSTFSDRTYDLDHERMVLAGFRRTQEQIQRPAYRFEQTIPDIGLRRNPPQPEPTFSDVEFEINMIKSFEIEHKKIKRNYPSIENVDKRIWFETTFRKDRQDHLEKAYTAFMKEKKFNCFFFAWLDWCAKRYNIPEYRNNIEMIGSPFSTYTSKDGKSVKAIHPPEMVIKQKDVIVAPYKETTFLEDSANNFCTASKEDVGAIIQHNNYTNLFLQSLGKQVTRIETSVSMKEQKSEPGPSETKRNKEVSQAFFKPPPALDNKTFKMGRTLSKKLSGLNLLDKGKGPQVSVLTEGEIDNLGTMFKEEQPEINRLMTEKTFTQTTKTKNYYPRPTPVNLQFEEDGMWNSAQYDRSSIVEWNIDGLTEYQIINTMKHMMMYTTTSKIKGNGDRRVAEAIIAGFVGQLKGWWDFHLTDSARTQILNAQVAIGQ
ncbi:hypothetical protein L3X38_010343 [Prunus dulcis]|uniref:Uncharacterized protein n=1 Tax=Prunus dulcis TaxID=3755 RepID=A0AAD4WFD5_PRUDU|nr:hypothetical protein L3X38_010343 [Prunus dulcis]